MNRARLVLYNQHVARHKTENASKTWPKELALTGNPGKETVSATFHKCRICRLHTLGIDLVRQ